jgi:3-oxoadipate enol-lactonase
MQTILQNVSYEAVGSGLPFIVLGDLFISAKQVLAPKKITKGLMAVYIDPLKNVNGLQTVSVAQQAETVNAVFEELGLKKAAVLGFSYGGCVALQFAAAYPHKCEKLLLAATSGYVGEYEREIMEGWPAAARNAETFYNLTIPTAFSVDFYDGKSDDEYTRLKNAFQQTFSEPGYLSGVKACASGWLDFDLRGILSKITASTLVVAAESDHIFSPLRQRELAKAMGAELVLLPNAGHLCPLETPSFFSALACGFAVQNA